MAAYQIKVLKQPNAEVLANLAMFGHSWRHQIAAKHFILTLKAD